MKQLVALNHFRKNVHSQFEEDGVIEKLFELMNINSGYLVEVGAWDGLYLSNTRYHLERNANFKACLIECDQSRYNDLIKHSLQREGDVYLNTFVEQVGENSLNEIFERHNIKDISLLSLDIDGNDFTIFASLDTTKYRPAIVIIEEGCWKDEHALNVLVNIFKNQGYNLVHITSNFIFVDKKYKIKATKNIHELIRLSGSPEYSEYFNCKEVEQIIEIED